MKKAFQESIQQALQKGWADFSTTLTGIEQEVQRRYKTVRQLVDPLHARAEIQETIQDMGRRIQATGEDLEREVEEKVRTVVSKIKDPLVEELETLRDQAERLGSRIDSHVRRLKREEVKEDGPKASDDNDRDAG